MVMISNFILLLPIESLFFLFRQRLVDLEQPWGKVHVDPLRSRIYADDVLLRKRNLKLVGPATHIQQRRAPCRAPVESFDTTDIERRLRRMVPQHAANQISRV